MRAWDWHDFDPLFSKHVTRIRQKPKTLLNRSRRILTTVSNTDKSNTRVGAARGDCAADHDTSDVGHWRPNADPIPERVDDRLFHLGETGVTHISTEPSANLIISHACSARQWTILARTEPSPVQSQCRAKLNVARTSREGCPVALSCFQLPTRVRLQ